MSTTMNADANNLTLSGPEKDEVRSITKFYRKHDGDKVQITPPIFHRHNSVLERTAGDENQPPSKRKFDLLTDVKEAKKRQSGATAIGNNVVLQPLSQKN